MYRKMNNILEKSDARNRDERKLTFRFRTIFFNLIMSALMIALFLNFASCGFSSNDVVDDSGTLQNASKKGSETEEIMMHERTNEVETHMKKELRLFINGTEVEAEWESHASVESLIEMAEKTLTVEMSMYGGFEQVGRLDKDLPRDDRHITTSAGDIMLYSGNQIVVFYGSNSWSYTKLGRITGMSHSELESLLAKNNVTMTLTYGGLSK